MRPAEWFSRRRDNIPLAGAAPRSAEEALGALGAAIRRRGHDGSDGESFRALVLAYCKRARDEDLTPERMLVRLKHALDDALAAADDDPTRRDETRSRVVRLAIDAYYDDRQ